MKSLSLVALVQTGMTASFETTPIVVNGVMYITTPVVNSKMLIIAVNAATGERLWDVTYNLGAFQICCGPVNRGVAVGYGKVYVVTLDDHLLALDAADGHTAWRHDHRQLAKRLLGDARAADLRRHGHRRQRRWRMGVARIRRGLRRQEPGSSAGAGCRPIRRPIRATPGRAAAGWCGRRPRSIPSSASSFSVPAIRTPISTARSAGATTSTPTASSRSMSTAASSSGTTRRSSMTCGTTTPSAMSCSSMSIRTARRFRRPPRRERWAGYSSSTDAPGS